MVLVFCFDCKDFATELAYQTKLLFYTCDYIMLLRWNQKIWKLLENEQNYITYHKILEF